MARVVRGLETFTPPEGLVPPQPARPGGFFSVFIQVVKPEVLQEWLHLGEDFQAHFDRLFGDFIFEVHKYLIRITPIDTGQLRGGWTAWLDRHNVDYARQLWDISIAEKAPGRDYHFDPAAIEEGKGYSQFEAPSVRDITIINSVPYGIFLELGTSKLSARNFVELTRFKAEAHFGQVLVDWLRQIEAAGKVIEPKPVEEIIA